MISQLLSKPSWFYIEPRLRLVYGPSELIHQGVFIAERPAVVEGGGDIAMLKYGDNGAHFQAVSPFIVFQ